MKKRQWIIMSITAIIILMGTILFLIYKKSWNLECQDFIDECYKKNFEFWTRGGHMYIKYSDGSTSLDYKANCPNDCSRYTEERGYFKNKKDQEKYYDNAVKECKKKYEECIQSGSSRDCHKCDKYGQPIYDRN